MGGIVEQEVGKETWVYDIVVAPKPVAFLGHCSDPRFLGAFFKFIREGLGLKFEEGHCIPIFGAGGLSMFSHPQCCPSDFEFACSRLRLHKKHYPEVRRFICIGHDDCGFYHRMATSRNNGTQANSLMREDIRRVLQEASCTQNHSDQVCFGDLIRELELELELYHAQLVDGGTKTRIVRVR